VNLPESLTGPALTRPRPAPQQTFHADEPTLVDMRNVVAMAERMRVPVVVCRNERSYRVTTVAEYDQIPTQRKQK